MDDSAFDYLDAPEVNLGRLRLLSLLSTVSLALPIAGTALGGAVWSLAGYVVVLFVTIPLALVVRLTCWKLRAETGQATLPTFIRFVPWLLRMTFVLAIVCVVRFSLAVA